VLWEHLLKSAPPSSQTWANHRAGSISDADIVLILSGGNGTPAACSLMSRCKSAAARRPPLNDRVLLSSLARSRSPRR
jgi:hypothetical protein